MPSGFLPFWSLSGGQTREPNDAIFEPPSARLRCCREDVGTTGQERYGPRHHSPGVSSAQRDPFVAGAVFGELSVLLDQPHTAEARALETSQFHIADATALLSQNPTAVLYVATVLAQRLDVANHALIQLKSQLQTREPHNVVAKTVGRVEQLLAGGGANLVYAGYPYDPFAQ